MFAAPRQEVASLPLNPSIRNKLLCAGFRTTGDLEGIGPVDLAAGGFLPHRGRQAGSAARYHDKPPPANS